MKFRCMIDIDKKIELTKVKATKSKVKVKFIVMGKHVSLLNMSWNVYPIFMPFIHRDPRYRVSWVIKLFFEICWHYWQPVPRVKLLVIIIIGHHWSRMTMGKGSQSMSCCNVVSGWKGQCGNHMPCHIQRWSGVGFLFFLRAFPLQQRTCAFHLFWGGWSGLLSTLGGLLPDPPSPSGRCWEPSCPRCMPHCSGAAGGLCVSFQQQAGRRGGH